MAMVKPLVIAVLLVGVTACGGGSTPAAATSPGTLLTAAERSDLASLEGRPVKLAALGPNGTCPETAMTTIKPYEDQLVSTQLYGNGPVFGAGGPPSYTKANVFYKVSYLADPTVTGVVLVRIATLDGAHKGVFVGLYGAGPVTGTDTIDGKRVDLRGEAAPGLGSAQGPTLAAGWASWPVLQGVDISWKCVVIQIDIQSATEAVMVAA
jgi:hypothetical protein